MKKYEVTYHDRGSISWRLDGNLHREDGPAITWPDGARYWYINGHLHREDGPAVILPNGHQAWLINGEYHREDGPAVIKSNGVKRWFLNSVEHTEEQFNRKMNPAPCDGTVVEIEGRQYKLVAL